MSQPSIKPAAQRWRNRPFGGKGVNATGGWSHQSKQPCVCLTAFKLHRVLCFCIKTWSCTQQLKIYSTRILVCFFTQLRCKTRAQCSFSAPLLCVYTANYWLGMDTAGLSVLETQEQGKISLVSYICRFQPLPFSRRLVPPPPNQSLFAGGEARGTDRCTQADGHTDRQTDVPSPVYSGTAH